MILRILFQQQLSSQPISQSYSQCQVLYRYKLMALVSVFLLAIRTSVAHSTDILRMRFLKVQLQAGDELLIRNQI